MDATVIESLLRADAFPHPVSALQLRQTHASWILLTGEWAYKIKKPVNFGFLDFSTLEKRTYYCHEEIRLNRRLCPSLYRAVVPVVQRDGQWFVGGEGVPVEHTVQMRQFDPEATLQVHLQRSALTETDWQTLGYFIAAFHQRAAVAPVDSSWGTLPAVLDPVWENLHQIDALLTAPAQREMLHAIRQWTESRAQALAPLFLRRRAQGFVRELHGDLHTGNIACIDGQWLPFDCIEFNPNLRWIDTASDIAFLLMDLDCQQHTAESRLLRNAYLEYSGDYGLLPLLDFYRVYRALVRVKVALLRQQQAAPAAALDDDVNRYLTYARQAQGVPSPFLVLMSGVSGSGKSTLARRLSGWTGAIPLRSDVTRKRLCGLTPQQSSGSENQGGIYTPAISRQTFAQLQQEADLLLRGGFAVIVDATFLRQTHRQPFRQLAQTLGVPFRIVQCHADHAERVRRIQQRQQQGVDASEASVAVMEQQWQQQEPLTEDERSFRVDGATLTSAAQWQASLQRQPDDKG